MGRLFFATMLLLSASSPSAAQRKAASGIPSDVGKAIASLYNATDTRRERGSVEIARDSVVQGSLAVRGGPVRIGGHITGSLLVINGDLVFAAGARVDGQVYVVGGAVTGRDSAEIGSDYRAYAETLRYRLTGDELVVEGESGGSGADDRDGDFWRGQRDKSPSTDFDFVAIAGSNAYNRVEGYPIRIGPQLRIRRDWGTFAISARGILRTAEPVDWGRGTLGHDARAEIRWGTGAGLGIGGTAFDRIEAVEGWHLNDNEAALAAAFIHRDYRDYYSRHGARAYATAYLNDDASVSVGYGAERWESRAERDPWTLFRGGEPWRLNPAVDDGRAHTLTGTLKFDTRNQSFSPGAGWFIRGDIEHATFDPTVSSAIPLQGGVPLQRTYTRGFVDARRYNRLAPGAQLNLRLVVGGWMNGDELPLERRLSVGGPGTLPGFDFRTTSGNGADRLQCSEGTGPARNVPVLCDRVALAQIEYRGDLSWHNSGDRNRRWLPSDFELPTWMVFADAGRGWRAHTDGVSAYPVEAFPDLNTFKTDVGFGFDFGAMSLSLAKSMSDRKEPMNFVVRLNRRF
jgi:hypothetical protein